MTTKHETLCPSAQPDWEGAKVFAVVGGTPDRPETAYLDLAQPVTDELLNLAAPVTPSEVFRFAAPCAKHSCQHFDDKQENCRLVEKTVQYAPIVVHKLAACSIRSTCRWWQQEGAASCQRCPQVVTLNLLPSSTLRKAGDPNVIA